MRKGRARKSKMVRRRRRRSIRKQTNDGKRFFKLKLVSTVTSDGTGLVKAGVLDEPSAAQDWTNVAALFDQYRVNAIKLKFIPESNLGIIGSTSYAPLYIVHDPDEFVNPLTTVNSAIQYENCKFKNMYRPWTYYRKMAKTIAQTGAQTTDLKGYHDCDNPQPNQGIYWIGTGFPNSLALGTLLVTYYITAKGRK